MKCIDARCRCVCRCVQVRVRVDFFVETICSVIQRGGAVVAFGCDGGGSRRCAAAVLILLLLLLLPSHS